MPSLNVLKTAIFFLHFGLKANISIVENVETAQIHMKGLLIDYPNFCLFQASPNWKSLAINNGFIIYGSYYLSSRPISIF